MSDNCGRAVNANLGRRQCPENVRVAAMFTTPRENQTSDNHLRPDEPQSLQAENKRLR